MEDYLRLILLCIAITIVFLILFEAWFRRRKLSREENTPLSPDEILGLTSHHPQQEPHFAALTHDHPQEPTLGDTESILTPEAEPALQDIELNKLLYSFEKEADLIVPHSSEQLLSSPPPSSPSPSVESPSENPFLVLSVLARPGYLFTS